MLFDIRTLLVAVAVASAFCAAARLLLWRMHPAMPGLPQWAAASVLGAASLLLFATHGWLPRIVALSLGQVLIGMGFIVAWDGFRRFVGERPLGPLVLALLVAAVVAPVAMSHAANSLPMRSVVNTVLVAGLSALIARDLLRAARPGRIAMRATGWLYAANAAFFAARAMAIDGDTTQVPLTSDGFHAFTLLWWLGTVVAITLGMALMAGERLQEELNHHANRDPLTGALNRRAFALMAEKQVAQGGRTGQPVAVLMMDLDHFKRINDTLGHSAGDATLCRFVRVAEDILRAEDVLCRFGGEEFVALLPHADAAQALAAAERLRKSFAATGATVSIGVAALRSGEDLEDMLRRADAALYEAKRQGRDRSHLAEDLAELPAPVPA